MTVNELRKARADHWESMKNFLNTHEQKDGTLSVDDTATYEKMEAKLEEYNASVERAEKAQAIENSMNAPASERIIDSVSKKSGADLRATDEYKAEFLNYLKTRRASNALQEGTSSEGGYLVPTDFERTLFAGRDKVDPIFDLAGRLFLGASEKNVPFVASHATATLVAEEGTYGGNDPSFGQVTLHAYKFGSLLKISEELMADSAFDMLAFLGDEIGKAMGNAQAAYFWTGTGTAQPQGVMTAAGAGVTAAAADKITADEIIDLYYSLFEQYRSVSSWAMNDSTVKAIRKLKLTGTGEYLWAPGLNGAPDTILGRPLRTSANIDGIAAGKKVIAFGDFLGCYKIADRQGVELKVLDQLYAETGQIGFRGSVRTDGKGILASEGIKVLTMAAGA